MTSLFQYACSFLAPSTAHLFTFRLFKAFYYFSELLYCFERRVLCNFCFTDAFKSTSFDPSVECTEYSFSLFIVSSCYIDCLKFLCFKFFCSTFFHGGFVHAFEPCTTFFYCSDFAFFFTTRL